MNTDVNSPPGAGQPAATVLRGRHRAPVEPRATLPAAVLPALLGGVAVVLVGLVVVWQVL